MHQTILLRTADQMFRESRSQLAVPKHRWTAVVTFKGCTSYKAWSFVTFGVAPWGMLSPPPFVVRFVQNRWVLVEYGVGSIPKDTKCLAWPPFLFVKACLLKMPMCPLFLNPGYATTVFVTHLRTFFLKYFSLQCCFNHIFVVCGLVQLCWSKMWTSNEEVRALEVPQMFDWFWFLILIIWRVSLFHSISQVQVFFSFQFLVIG